MLLASAWGCSDPDSPGREAVDAVVQRDSAGVRIVVSHDSAWTAATRWRLAEEPALRLGSADGAAPGTGWGFVSDVTWVDGHIVIGDSQSRTIEVFDAEGGFVRSLAGSGDGPHELRAMEHLHPVADSVAVWDARQRKVVVYPIDGGTPSVRPFAGLEPAVLVDAVLPDGRMVVGPIPAYGPDELPISDRITVGRAYRVAREPGHDGAAIPELPYYMVSNSGEGLSASPLLYAPLAGFEPGGTSHVWYGWPADAYELKRFPLDKPDAPDLIVRRGWSASALPERIPVEMDAYFDSAFAATPGLTPEQVAERRRALDAIVVADPIPAYWEFEVSPDGYVWANDLRGPDELTLESVFGTEMIATLRWSVLDPDGRWLGTIEMPEGFLLHHVGEDFVLGVRTDALGVQYVERLDIVRPD